MIPVIPPEIERIKKIIKEWAVCYPRITRVYLYGSYVKKNKPIPNDIDIAVEISKNRNDPSLAYWISEADKMEEQLIRFFNYKVDLEWFDGANNKTIKKGLEEGNVLIYERMPVKRCPV